MQLEPVEHAMLNIYPDEVGLCRCEKLGHECAWDTVSDSEQCLCWICLGVSQGLSEVSRVCEHSSTVGCLSMQMRLLAVGLVFCHRVDLVADFCICGRSWFEVCDRREMEVFSTLYGRAY